jgi:S-phase kinase-associated protein 1
MKFLFLTVACAFASNDFYRIRAAGGPAESKENSIDRVNRENIELEGLGGLDDDSDFMSQPITLVATVRCMDCPTDEGENGEAVLRMPTSEQIAARVRLCNMCEDKHYVPVQPERAYQTTREAVLKTGYFKEMFSHSRQAAIIEEMAGRDGEDQKENVQPRFLIPAQVTPDALAYVVNYLNNLGDRVPKDIVKPIRNTIMNDCIAVEDREDAVRMEALYNGPGKRAVFDVIIAANYLNNKDLLHLGCVKIATLIKGQSPARIKEILGDEDAETAAQATTMAGQRRRLLEALYRFKAL